MLGVAVCVCVCGWVGVGVGWGLTVEKKHPFTIADDNHTPEFRALFHPNLSSCPLVKYRTQGQMYMRRNTMGSFFLFGLHYSLKYPITRK